MDGREELIAPCGLDCGICELYTCRDDETLKAALVSRGVPAGALPCEGCRRIEGACPVLPESCATSLCVRGRGHSHCSECEDFPCKTLAPAADRADRLPHNLKIFNLCVLARHGAGELVKRSQAIKDAYFKGKMKIGEGPVMAEE